MKATVSILSILAICIVFVGCSGNNISNELPENKTIYEKSVTFPIEGMSCMACVARIRKTLSGLEGVYEVTVNLENKNAVIKYNPQKITIDKIQQTINEMGYKAGKTEEIRK